jgi:hypothetical protein
VEYVFAYKGAEPTTLTLGATVASNVITLRYETETYTVIYRDGANGEVFGDESHGMLKE